MSLDLRGTIVALVVVMMVAGFAAAASAPSGPKFQILYSFSGNQGGLYGSVVLDSAGNIYASERGGGTYNYGAVFELSQSKGHWTETILHSFSGDEGVFPMSSLTADKNVDNLYGFTASGGPNSVGTVFGLKRTSRGWAFTLLNPYGSGNESLSLADRAGNLYGNVGRFSQNDDGIAEMVRKSRGWTRHILYAFCKQTPCAEGAYPWGGVTFDRTANIYGTTYYGGDSKSCPFGQYGCGVVFELIPQAKGEQWKEQVLHFFATNDSRIKDDGFRPMSGVVFDKLGNLYGTTTEGGSMGCNDGVGCGTVYRLTPGENGWIETILYNFADPDYGAGPSSTLVFDQPGNLWGTAGGGKGQCSCGVVFKMTPQADGKWKYEVVHNFEGTDGAFPFASVVFDRKGISTARL